MKTIIITSGGTSEKIDEVRKITNNSTGKLGSIIADTLLKEKNKNIKKIYYVCSQNSLLPKENKKIEIIRITNTNDLKETVINLLSNNQIDYFIHSMAVSDYTVDYVTNTALLASTIKKNKNNLNNIEDIINHNVKTIDNQSKISSNESDLIIKLKQTPKIIGLIKDISPKTYLVGFKLLDNVSEKELLEKASSLLIKNKCNLVVANDLQGIRNDSHKAIIINQSGKQVFASNKEDIAYKLTMEIFQNE